MPQTFVSRALHRAVALALFSATPLLVGCGGRAPSSCGLTSAQPTAPACDEQSFAFQGTAAACGADSFGALSPSQCESLCPILSGSVAINCSVDWGVNPEFIKCGYADPVGGGCAAGRRPAGLRAPEQFPALAGAGRLLAQVAHLEAASAHAFAFLAEELAEHGAPIGLRAASRRAALDETRHAAVIEKFAERAGARVPAVQIERQRLRTLEMMAVENAIEGCVGETYGAAIAHFQANQASDPTFRLAMKRIAVDETRHAELAFELARWFDENLSNPARCRVRAAQRQAVRARARSVKHLRYRDGAAITLGLPTAQQAAVLVEELRRSVWH